MQTLVFEGIAESARNEGDRGLLDGVRSIVELSGVDRPFRQP